MGLRSFDYLYPRNPQGVFVPPWSFATHISDKCFRKLSIVSFLVDEIRFLAKTAWRRSRISWRRATISSRRPAEQTSWLWGISCWGFNRNPETFKISLFGSLPPSLRIDHSTSITEASVSAFISPLLGQLSPFLEEPIFRGFLYVAFRRSYGITTSIALSVVLHHLLHLEVFTTWYMLIMRTGLTVMLCYLRRKEP